jgi:glutamate dehydrogenase/leucine dehydrogenase
MPTTHEAIAAAIKAKVVFLDKVADVVGVSGSGFEMTQNNIRLARQGRAGRTVEKYHA